MGRKHFKNISDKGLITSMCKTVISFNDLINRQNKQIINSSADDAVDKMNMFI